jgi:hypothetical protein
VLDDHDLSPAQKRDVLPRWALDAYLIELALFKGEPQSEPSRLDEVIDALFDLWRRRRPARQRTGRERRGQIVKAAQHEAIVGMGPGG